MLHGFKLALNRCQIFGKLLELGIRVLLGHTGHDRIGTTTFGLFSTL